MLTRAETFEYLKEYSIDESRIELVLMELGEDPEALEFPDDLVERAEKVFETLGIAKQKVLKSASGQQPTPELIVRQTSDIAKTMLEAEGIVGFEAETIMFLAQATVENAAELAEQLTDLREKTLVEGLRQGNQRLAQKMMNGLMGGNSISQQIFSESAQAEFVNDAVAVNPANVDPLKNYISGRRQARLNRQQPQALTPVVNIKAFLAEQRCQ